MWWKSDQRTRAKAGHGCLTNSRPCFGLFLLAAVLGLACLCMSGCGTDDIDISGCAEETITLTGAADREITLSVADLKAMDCITRTTESTSDKIGQVRATGPTLDTVLKTLGLTQADVEKVHIYARDDYDVKLGSDVLETEDVILAFGMDGEPLTEEDAPVRIIIPESDSAYWIRMVEKIELTLRKDSLQK